MKGIEMNKYCQGPKCHTYMTTDRKRGMKGDKYFQTRSVSRGYGDDNFCTTICLGDWWSKHGTRAIDHFGRLHEPIRLARENAWVKNYTWENDISGHVHYFINKLTTERIPLTEAQYDDNDYTIERARQT
jgi:hypothetical protein